MNEVTKKITEHENAPKWLFAFFLVAFILLKIPHLALPFFWDESGVYGQVIFHLADTQLSMHPNAINEWISRGHPLLYPNLIAGICKVFGVNVTAAHTANFSIACFLLISMYFCLSRKFHPWIGLIACTLLMMQPIFYAQSVFVLPEIALTFFLWLATWSFIQKKYLIYFLSGSASVLIKEPAIIWLGSIFLWDFLNIRKLKTWKILLWLTPLIPFCIFLYVQKQTYGWFFFPYHTGGFDYNLMGIVDKAGDYVHYLFMEQGRLIWLIIILLSLIIFLNKTGKPRIEYPGISTRYYSAIFAVIAYLIFSSTTFYAERYILPVFPVICAMIGYLFFHLIAQRRYGWILVFLGITALISYFFMASDKFNYDNDMSYIRSVESSKKTIRYMLDHKMLEQDEFSATMPIIFAIHDPRFGYLPKEAGRRESRVIHAGTKYVVKVTPGTNIENPEQYPLRILADWYDHDIHTSIYQVMPVDTPLVR